MFLRFGRRDRLVANSTAAVFGRTCAEGCISHFVFVNVHLTKALGYYDQKNHTHHAPS